MDFGFRRILDRKEGGSAGSFSVRATQLLILNSCNCKLSSSRTLTKVPMAKPGTEGETYIVIVTNA